jgi:hypothetical protein
MFISVFFDLVYDQDVIEKEELTLNHFNRLTTTDIITPHEVETRTSMR